MPPQELRTGRSFIGTFVLIFIALAALFVIDTFLARVEGNEDRAEATRLAESSQNAAIEANLDLAEQLWQAGGKTCASSMAASQDPLSLVLARIAQ
jgi:hypothetical protein